MLADGKIVHSGDKDLALKLEEQGYGWIERGWRRRLTPGWISAPSAPASTWRQRLRISAEANNTRYTALKGRASQL